MKFFEAYCAVSLEYDKHSVAEKHHHFLYYLQMSYIKSFKKFPVGTLQMYTLHSYSFCEAFFFHS